MYLIIEGIDCSGKTTQADMLEDSLGKKPIRIHQPGTTELGKWIRQIVKGEGTFDDLEIMSPRAIDLLFQADNLELGAYLDKLVKFDHNFVSDRCNIISSLAYGSARGTALEVLHSAITEDIRTHFSLKPDKIVILDINWDTFKQRQQFRGEKLDNIEGKGEIFMKKVLSYYKEMPNLIKQGNFDIWNNIAIEVIDGTQSAANVHNNIMRFIQ